MLPFEKDNFCKNMKKTPTLCSKFCEDFFLFPVLAPKFLPDEISVNKITQISKIVLNALQPMS